MNTNDNSPYCNFIDTNTVFNGKKIFECSYCGIKLGLDDSETQILCFKKIQDFTMSIRKIQYPSLEQPMNIGSNEAVQDIVLNKILENQKQLEAQEKNKNNPDNLCSEEEIEARLKICNSCEHYKENSCLLCGCQIVREANYMNKLAHKDQKCPADKWGPLA